MLFLQYPPCSTCKKAKAWLDGQGLSYTSRHIKEAPPSYEELSQWVRQSGLIFLIKINLMLIDVRVFIVPTGTKAT